MDRSKSERAPNFFWQGVLIILPVVGLAVVGCLSLRQDKRMAEAEARQRANELADSLMTAIQEQFGYPRLTANPLFASPQRLQDEVRSFKASPDLPAEEPILRWSESPLLGERFQLAIVNERRELIYPPPVRDVPPPQSIDGSRLTPAQSNLWSQIQAAQFVQRNATSAIDACDRLVQTGIPAGWSARLAYNAGMLLKEQGRWREALERFTPLAASDACELSDAGIPLRQLALLQMGTLALEGGDRAHQIAIEWSKLASANTNVIATPANSSGWIPAVWNRLCAESILHPTVLSEYFLNEALERAQGPNQELITGWLKVWRSHQASREAYQRLVQAGHANTAFPERLNGEQWMGCLNQNDPTKNGVLFAQSKRDVVNGIGEILRRIGAEPLPSRIRLDFVRSKNAIPPFELKGDFDTGLLGFETPLRVPPYFGVIVRLGHELPELPEFASFSVLAQRDSTSEVYPGFKTMGLVMHGVSSRGFAGEPSYGTPFDFKLLVYLENPAALYAHQRQRALMFGSLIAVAAVAALIGFFAARRAFHRQLHLSEMKSNFVSSVSHELRAPIASVRLMAEGLERGKVQDPKKQNEYFRFIVQECRRLSSLIENVLDFSRIEQGRKQYEFEPTDVAALVQQTVRLMETYAAEQQIKLALQITGEPHPFEMDGKAIQQALINLLDNAIKHSPKGSVISVGLAFETSQTPSILHLWVEDQGEGIPPAEHEKIFERFYRLGSELRRETQGVGIGLSIVRHIVQAHHGNIQVRSAPGQGSRFTIELPANQYEK